DDATLRPNQLIAAALPYGPVSNEQAQAMVAACASRLLTSFGLRTLPPDHPDFAGHYGGGAEPPRAPLYHGPVWGGLIGLFVDACRQAGLPADSIRSYLEPFAFHLADAGQGSISEIFEGEAPFEPVGCIAQAWSVAEVLRAWMSLAAVG